MSKHEHYGKKIHALVEKLIVEETKLADGDSHAASAARKLLVEIKQVAKEGYQSIEGDDKEGDDE